MRHFPGVSVTPEIQTRQIFMRAKPQSDLRTGFTTGACATAATRAAYLALTTGSWISPVEIILPKGQRPSFELAETEQGPDWARAVVQKDAGDDPDVTHGALICVKVSFGPTGEGVRFRAGPGVGTVTRPGLPIAPGEAAINPVPRRMMEAVIAQEPGPGDVIIEISVPGGAALAKKTWNPRLGIEGGISILGTTGIVRPYSCAAWIASIHRGIDVARANGEMHVAGSTGATSERVAQIHLGLPDHAMLDMGDFAGGMLKYLRRHPVARVTVAGGFGKLTKLAQGALDLHSSRSQVDLRQLADWAGRPELEGCNTAMEVLSVAGPLLAADVARRGRLTALEVLKGTDIELDTLIVGRDGRLQAWADADGGHVFA